MWKLSLIALPLCFISKPFLPFLLLAWLCCREYSVVHLTPHITLKAIEGLLLSNEVRAHSHHLIILLTRFNPRRDPSDEEEEIFFPLRCFTLSRRNRFQHVTNIIAHHHLTAVNNSVTCCPTIQLLPFNSLILQSNNAFGWYLCCSRFPHEFPSNLTKTRFLRSSLWFASCNFSSSLVLEQTLPFYRVNIIMHGLRGCVDGE